jgi:hypothetical protein
MEALSETVRRIMEIRHGIVFDYLGIQKKHWSYELLLRIKHCFGISAEAFLYRLNEL